MQFVKIVLIFILMVTLGGAGLLVANNRGWWQPPTAMAQVVHRASQAFQIGKTLNQHLPGWKAQFEKLPLLSQQVDPQLQILGARTEEVRQHVNGVVSQSIKESNQPTPLHEKAFERAQYVYCQQVVKEYEESDPELSTSSAQESTP